MCGEGPSNQAMCNGSVLGLLVDGALGLLVDGARRHGARRAPTNNGEPINTQVTRCCCGLHQKPIKKGKNRVRDGDADESARQTGTIVANAW